MTHSKLLLALGAAAMMFAAAANPALADRRGYCDAYAREAAARKSGAGDVLAGTIGGAIAGAVLGGIIDKGEGAGKGAIIGGGAGTILGLGLSQDARQRAWHKAYAKCMGQYEPAPVRARAGNGEAWLAYCAAKYRSFNAETGYYRAGSGKLRRCK